MRRILVTGGAGFIGSHLCARLLSMGEEVVILDDLNPSYDPQLKRQNLEMLDGLGELSFIEGDIRDAKTVDRVYRRHGISVTVHLAARAGVRASLLDPRTYCEVNEIGTLNLLDAARKWGAYTFIFGSSSSVYGINPKVPFAEDDALGEMVSPYAASKRAAELYCRAWHENHRLKITCLRFFTVYGPRQRPEMAIHRFFEKVAAGETIPMFGDGSSERDYTYVDDIVDGVIAAIERAYPWAIINLGGSHSVRLDQLIAAIGQAAGADPMIQQLPEQPGDVPRTMAAVERAQSMLGWSPKVGLDEGLSKTAAWFAERARAVSIEG